MKSLFKHISKLGIVAGIASMTLGGPAQAVIDDKMGDFNEMRNSAFFGTMGAHRNTNNDDNLVWSTPDDIVRTGTSEGIVWTGLLNRGIIIGTTVAQLKNGLVVNTSGRGKGYSHMHAHDKKGNLVWELPPWYSERDERRGKTVGPSTYYTFGMVDKDGWIYSWSGPTMFKIDPDDGSIVWHNTLPRNKCFVRGMGVGAVYGSTQGMNITNHEVPLVGGSCLNGEMVYWNSQTGELQIHTDPHPWDSAPLCNPAAGAAMWVGMLSRKTSVTTACFFQTSFKQTPSPASQAIHPRTNRIIMTYAYNREVSQALIWEFVEDENGTPVDLKVIENIVLENLSGRSTTYTPGTNDFLVNDNEGWFYVIDPDTGDLKEKGPAGLNGIGSAASDAKGIMYSCGGDRIKSTDSRDNSVLWEQPINHVADEFFEPKRPYLFLMNGQPNAYCTGLVGIGGVNVTIQAQLGYHTKMLSWFPPMANVTATPETMRDLILDIHTGEITTQGEQYEGGSEAVLHGDWTSHVYSPRLEAQKSTFFLFLNPVVPPRYRVDHPHGGFIIYEPESFRKAAVQQAESSDEYAERALKSLADGDYGLAYRQTAMARGLIDVATVATFEQAALRRNATAREVADLEDIAAGATAAYTSATNTLLASGAGDPTGAELNAFEAAISLARQRVDAAVSHINKGTPPEQPDTSGL